LYALQHVLPSIVPCVQIPDFPQVSCLSVQRLLFSFWPAISYFPPVSHYPSSIQYLLAIALGFSDSSWEFPEWLQHLSLPSC